MYPCASVGQMVDDFEAYRDRVRRRRVVLGRPNGEQISLPSTCGSRYFADGRRKIMAKIRRRLGNKWDGAACLVTLTYAPKRISRPVAWEYVGRHRRELMNKLWQYRRRHGMGRKPLGYLSVIEVQPGTSYPHVHVVLPRIDWLIDNRILERLWGHGWTHVEKCDAVSPAGYICKYVAKMRDWSDECLAYLHNFGVRMYSIGRRYFLPLFKEYSPWFFVAQIIAPPQAVVCPVCPDTT